MASTPTPQVAQDLPALLDPAIMYASRAGEHKGVMQQSVEMHKIKKNMGDVWKGAHVAKIEAFHGGPRTRFTNTARHSAEVYECHLGYTVSLISMADNQRNFLNKEYLRQLGAQQSEAIARDVDRILLSTFQRSTEIEDRSGNPILANQLLDAMFKLDAAEDDSESPVQIIAPVAHLQDLVHEFTTTSNNAAVIARPLTDAAARMLRQAFMYDIGGTMIKVARNAPKYGTDGYTGVYRKTAIKMVTAPVLMREKKRMPEDGGGAEALFVRKLWGHTIPPMALRNWFNAVHARMPIGGR